MLALEKTHKIFADLVGHLICGLCNRSVEKPAVLGSCEHFFCKKCVEEYLVGESCPRCNVPSHAKDVMTNRQLSTAVSLVKQLDTLLAAGSRRAVTQTAPQSGLAGGALSVHDSSKSLVENGDVHIEHPQGRKPVDMLHPVKQNSSTSQVPPTHKEKLRKREAVVSSPHDPEKKLRVQVSDSMSTRIRMSTPQNISNKRLSLSASPAINKKNPKGETPLQVACIKGDVEHVRELLSHGATPNVKDHAGWTPLHECVHYNHLECARELLDCGALVNVPGCDNDTPLHDAVSSGSLCCVKLLLSYGADRRARNGMGKTALELAESTEMKQVLMRETTLCSTPTSKTKASELIHEVTILPTSIDRKHKAILQKLASIIHAKVVKSFSPSVTHVVTTVNAEGQCARTYKYLQAILSGKWIVSFDWVQTCLEYGKRVPEEPFEVPGASTTPDSFASMKGRQNADCQNPGLFDGCRVFLHADLEACIPSRSDLAGLVQLGGGRVLSREPRELQEAGSVPFHIPLGHCLDKCHHFIISQQGVGMQGEELCRVSPKWLMDCIAYFKILPPV